MKDSTLLKTALVTSIVGVVALFFILQNTELEESRIVDLEEMNEGDEVKIIGVVESVKKSNDVTIISISQKEIVEGVIFDDVDIHEGELVHVVGEIGEFKGEKEVIIDRIIRE
ncbi:MAG: hypothetical protein ISS25_01460 [Nanoarchaeota archaeon]|nr:hypothetical protein [DPANN group archaeon]MBL7116481.1 hypothetical protein [Nanoarchaeota archaeon]